MYPNILGDLKTSLEEFTDQTELNNPVNNFYGGNRKRIPYSITGRYMEKLPHLIMSQCLIKQLEKELKISPGILRARK